MFTALELPACSARDRQSRASTFAPVARIFSTRSSGYDAAPVMTGMGSICWVDVTICPPGRRNDSHRAASNSSKDTMWSASPRSITGDATRSP